MYRYRTFVRMLYALLPLKSRYGTVHFSCSIQFFVTVKSDQDPDPDGTALVLATWIRIQIRIETNADPQHWLINPAINYVINCVIS